jgi:hypothetical protein
LAVACGDDGGDDGNGGGGAGASGNGGGGNGGMVAEPDPINANCPANQGPFDEPYGLKGKCCYRKSNTARLASMTGDSATLEYRLTSFLPKNIPELNTVLINTTTYSRFDNEEQHLLFRFTLPRTNGEWAMGDGTAQIGAGRYNCDGTYSFYNDSAAPVVGNITDKGRWEASKVAIKFDPTADNWEDQAHTVWATSTNRGVTYLPYIMTMGDKALEWEAASQGFNIIEMPAIEDAIDCIGSRPDMSTWMAGGKSESYQRLDLNHASKISTLLNISLAQLQSFGAFVSDPNDANKNRDTPAYDPTKAERCMPGSGCVWKKLPDSLCPVSEDEQSKWGCHVGYKNNPDNVMTNCTMEAPSGVLDPDKGSNVSQGQCCDPLAKNTDGLPACNAFRLVSEFSAAAAEITDNPSGTLQPKCNPAGGPAN